ncbi:MAG: NAD-dependent protein deacylase [Clostridiales bacterium]|nr:NAD-dependent protein deacylase [Clostridiales bacterium]
MDDTITKLKEMIYSSENIVFFGGAGVSTESGIPDFRSSDGIYNTKGYKVSPEVLISLSYFDEHPDEFYDFYKKHLIFPNAKPNKAHIALAKLEKEGRLKAVVTQNVDGLHQAAGSKTVHELHGSVERNYCLSCRKKFDLEYIISSEGVPKCDSCGGIIKPDVVLYEEPLDDRIMLKSINAIESADMLIIGGTSLAVYPAAGLIRYFNGKHLAIINKSATSYDDEADILIKNPIGETLGEIVK